MSSKQIVFISHSSKDRNFANAICHTLESNGVRCWIAPRDIMPGKPYGAAIIDAIEKCGIMVVVFTSNANDSVPVNNEIERAVNKGAIVIPVRFQDIAPSKNLEFFISSNHWLDAFTDPIEEHLEKLSNTIKTLFENTDSILTDEKVVKETVPETKATLPMSEGEKEEIDIKKIAAKKGLEMQAERLFESNKHAEAIEVYKKLIADHTNGNDAEAHFYRYQIHHIESEQARFESKKDSDPSEAEKNSTDVKEGLSGASEDEKEVRDDIKVSKSKEVKNGQATGISAVKQKKVDEVTKEVIKVSSLKEIKLQNIISQIEANMVYVEGGTFTMGSTSEKSKNHEKLAHAVMLSSFRINKYVVTQEEWVAVMGNNPSKYEYDRGCPVEQISWNTAQKFIGKLNNMTGGNYRLPTEAEWEYAARGGNKSKRYRYSGGDDYGKVAWYEGNSKAHPHPVGQKQPNELGLYDMSGNVWEWCSDWYHQEYYANSPSQNPKGPSIGKERVLRGGAFSNSITSCTVAERFSMRPSISAWCYGFRLARD